MKEKEKNESLTLDHFFQTCHGGYPVPGGYIHPPFHLTHQ
jgi:hypothetical protein